MLPKNILQALKQVYAIISKEDVLWVLTGSTVLSIQGVDVKIGDIDILTDKQGSQIIDKLLSKFRIQKPEHSSTDKYQSYFGIYRINDVQVHVQGEFQHRMKDGSWSKPHQNKKPLYKEFEGMRLPMYSLQQELEEYQNLGRTQKVKQIKAALQQQKIQEVT